QLERPLGGGFADRPQRRGPEHLGLVAVERLERCDDLGAELRACVCAEFLHRLRNSATYAIGTGAGEGVECAGDEDYARGKGDLVAGQAIGISGAVDPLVTRAGDLKDDRVEVDLGEDVLGDDGVLPHDLPLLLVEWAGLVENPLGDSDLP